MANDDLPGSPRARPHLGDLLRSATTAGPVARDGDDGHAPTVGFLELFYDLAFVASTMVLSNAFSSRPTWAWAAVCALVYALLWLLWFHTTVLMNVERHDDFGHRTLVLAQMFLISLTALTFVDRDATNNDYLGLAYGAAVLVVGALYHRVARADLAAAPWARSRRNRLLLAGVLLLANTALPDWADYLMFAAAIVILVAPSALGSGVRRPLPAVDVHHLSERAALLTLIMCGEAFVKVGIVVSTGSIEEGDLVAMVVEFVVIFAFFWTYFDDVPVAGIRSGPAHGEVWTLSHLPLQLGIVGIAIGMSKFLQVADGHVHPEVALILGTAFLLVYGGLALVGWFGEREPRMPLLVLRVGTAAAAVALALLDWFVVRVQPNGFVVVLALLAVAHAVAARAMRLRTTVRPGAPV